MRLKNFLCGLVQPAHDARIAALSRVDAVQIAGAVVEERDEVARQRFAGPPSLSQCYTQHVGLERRPDSKYDIAGKLAPADICEEMSIVTAYRYAERRFHLIQILVGARIAKDSHRSGTKSRECNLEEPTHLGHRG
jgi:hypothetical protein